MIPSTLVLPPSTAPYAAFANVASSASAAALVVPSFVMAPPCDISRLCLSVADPAWSSAELRIDLWTNQPTFDNGDRSPYSIADGSPYFGSFGVTMLQAGSSALGEGLRGEPISVDIDPGEREWNLGSRIYWSVQTLNGTNGQATLPSRTFNLGVVTIRRR